MNIHYLNMDQITNDMLLGNFQGDVPLYNFHEGILSNLLRRSHKTNEKQDIIEYSINHCSETISSDDQSLENSFQRQSSSTISRFSTKHLSLIYPEKNDWILFDGTAANSLRDDLSLLEIIQKLKESNYNVFIIRNYIAMNI